MNAQVSYIPLPLPEVEEIPAKTTLRERVAELAQELNIEGAPVRQVSDFGMANINDQGLASLIVKHSDLYTVTVQEAV